MTPVPTERREPGSATVAGYLEVRNAPSWALCLAVSLACHAAVGLLLFFGIARHDQPAPPPEQQAMAIQIMAAPAAPPTPARDIPPGPQRIENRQARQTPVKTKVDIPPAPVVRDVTPEVVIPPQQANSDPPEPKPVAKETTAQSAAPAPPKPLAAAPAQGAPTAAVSKTEQTWEGLVLAKIERTKRYPGEAERQGQQDLVYVDVTIDRTGRILRVSVEKSQNIRLLDNAALDAVRRASPLPRPPDSEKGDVIAFAIPIEFYLKH